jgi:hypothetical protein
MEKFFLRKKRSHPWRESSEAKKLLSTILVERDSVFILGSEVQSISRSNLFYILIFIFDLSNGRLSG